MGSLVFIGILATGAFVILWFLQNHRAGADGGLGWLALRDDPASARPDAKRGSYRIKRRLRPRSRRPETAALAAAPAPAAPTKPTYRIVTEAERLRKRYRRQDEARYAVKDKASRFKRDDDD